MKQKYVVVIGNPFDGLGIHGPFPSREEAEEWAEDAQNDWWIVELYDPT